MQSYSQNAQESNIFAQLRAWKSKRADELTNREINKITSLRNDKTHVDEALIVVRIVLVFVTLFTAYCGFLFYDNTFSKVLSPTATWWAALGLAGSVEAAKVFLTHRALRSVFFGWMFRSFWGLGGWVFISLLGLGSYVWSVRISTDGMNLLTTEVAEQQTERANLGAMIKANTVDIDAQICRMQGVQSDAMNTKWKNTTTWRAQKIAAGSSSAIASLQDQRAAIVRQITADYANGNQKREASITNWAYWIKQYGGYMEIVAGFCLISIVFFERRLVAENMKVGGPAPSPVPNEREQPQPRNGFQPRQSAPSDSQSSYFNSSAPSVRMGFALTEQKPVRSSSTDSDFIQLRMKRLKGWDDNFNDPKNKPETVATNMTLILNEIGKKMQEDDFNPDPATMQSLIEYITGTGLPAMERAGYFYKYKEGFLDLATRYAGAAAA